MNLRFHVCLGLMLGTFSLIFNARGEVIIDPLMDALLDEEVTANKLDQDSSNVADIQFSYEILLQNLKAYQKAHPQAYTELTADTISSLELRLEIVKWQKEGIAEKNPNDPRGFVNVAARLDEREHQAEQTLGTGKLDDANRQFMSCCSSWLWVKFAHPDWEPEKVQWEVNRCESGMMHILMNKRAAKPPHFRYVDPKLGTPLSV
jgi:hypothetical protein